MTKLRPPSSDLPGPRLKPDRSGGGRRRCGLCPHLPEAQRALGRSNRHLLIKLTIALGFCEAAAAAEDHHAERNEKVPVEARRSSSRTRARSGAKWCCSPPAAGARPRRWNSKIAAFTDERGKIEVNRSTFRTKLPHIFAVGDVIGFPSLASTSMEQGRIAACHAFDAPAQAPPEFFPYGIYSVPEMSTIGMTEEQVREKRIPYECGVARFRETARGQIMGLNAGFMKMIFSIETRRLLGVHIVGEGATELIHIGQAVLNLGGTLDYFVENTFNYPTLAEAYKIAALTMRTWNRMPRKQPSTSAFDEGEQQHLSGSRRPPAAAAELISGPRGPARRRFCPRTETQRAGLRRREPARRAACAP